MMLSIGIVLPYLTSYFNSFDPSITSSDVFIIQSVCVFADSLGMSKAYLVISPFLKSRIGIRLTLLVGTVLLALNFLISSFLTSFVPFVLVFPVLLGLGSGLIMMNSIWICWDYFSYRKELVTGIGLAGLGAGPFVLGPLFAFLINPEDTPAISSFFPFEVYSRIPLAFRLTAIGYTVLGLISILLLKPMNKPDEIETGKEKEKAGRSLKSKDFWMIFGTTLCGFAWWVSVIGLIKTFAIENGMSDHFVSFALSLSSLVGVAGRVVFPVLSGLLGHRWVLGSIYLSNFAMSLLLNLTNGHQYLFAFMVCTIYFTCSGIYPCVAVFLSDVFGERQSQALFPYLYTAVSLAGIIDLACAHFGESIGFLYVWIIFSCVLVLGIASLLGVKRKFKDLTFYRELV